MYPDRWFAKNLKRRKIIQNLLPEKRVEKVELKHESNNDRRRNRRTYISCLGYSG